MNDKIPVASHTRARKGLKTGGGSSHYSKPGNGRSLVRHRLVSLEGLLHEAANVYRAARAGKMDHAEARSFIWMLAQMRAMAEAKTRSQVIDATPAAEQRTLEAA